MSASSTVFLTFSAILFLFCLSTDSAFPFSPEICSYNCISMSCLALSQLLYLPWSGTGFKGISTHVELRGCSRGPCMGLSPLLLLSYPAFSFCNRLLQIMFLIFGDFAELIFKNFYHRLMGDDLLGFLDKP